MRCVKAKKMLPLYAGGDLRPRLARKVQSHLEACASCRKEFEELRAAISQAKAASRAEGVRDWSEGEWQALMVRITKEAAPRRARIFGLQPRLAFASGLAAIIVLALVGFLLRDRISRPKEMVPGPTIVNKEEPKPSPTKTREIPPAGPKEKGVPIIQPEIFAAKTGREQPQKRAAVPGSGSQDVVSVTLVSQETGLQVVWFFNKNFEWKGDQK